MIPRQHPLLSPIAIISTVILLFGLGMALYMTGGRAFSPGELSAETNISRQSGGFDHHAAFADDCTQCHTPFAGIAEANCLACHTIIDEQIAMSDGLHGNLTNTTCTLCHSEHQGGDFNLVADALITFEPSHHAAFFALDGAHAAVACADCHTGAHYIDTPTDCVNCHAEPDIHAGLFGTTCTNCHTTVGWQPATLTNHTFIIDHGGLTDLPCQACHADTYTAYSCATCHEPSLMADEHDNIVSTSAELAACATCHVTGTEAEMETLEIGRD